MKVSPAATANGNGVKRLNVPADQLRTCRWNPLFDPEVITTLPRVNVPDPLGEVEAATIVDFELPDKAVID